MPYGSHGQSLDIYRPEDLQSEKLPIVVFVHGGSWEGGSRGGYAFAGRGLARLNALVFVIDYRKLPDNRFPDFHEDVAEAISWAHDNAGQYGGDPSRLFLIGHSAGAHIAMLSVLNSEYLAAVGLTDDVLAGVVGISGPYDFYPFTVDSARRAFAGADPMTTQPLAYARGDAPPMLLLHGRDDNIVLPENSRKLAEAVREEGGDAKLKIYPGLSHSGAVMALSPLFKGKASVAADIAEFIGATGT